MSKIRVYNLAKMFEMSNTEMVELLTEIGVNIKSHMSSIDEEVSILVEEELKRRKDAEEKKAVEAITTYPVVTISEGSSVSDVAASIGEKPGSAVKVLMAEGLMVPATVAADEKIL
ncbi:MAG: translation initiation factor IF-2 N-terminal domain-containing protein, partial [Synergistaceae bacterium]|nr:translation initiation factor IF-2 N-terminal domain-containing protein [Synergistaceae bacterium]